MSVTGHADVSQKSFLQAPMQRVKQVIAGRTRLHALLVSLDWKQWLVLFAMGILIVTLEVRNHGIMWQEHRSNQTIWTDQELLWEIFVYGFLTPILVGLIIGHIGRIASDRDRVANELRLRREVVRRISLAHSWHELAEQVVAVPSTIVPAEHVYLLAQRSPEEDFAQVAHWERTGSEFVPSFIFASPAVCTRCLMDHAHDGKRIWRCPHSDNGKGQPALERYCLCLSAEGGRKAALLVMVPYQRPLDAGQMNMLTELGDEMALAIDKASLRILEQNHDDIARNERRRMARDLHDTVGQNVSYLRLKLEQLGTAPLTSDGAEFQDALSNMLEVANETYIQVRDTLQTLRGDETRSVEEAIRQYAQQSGQRTGFAVVVRSTGAARDLTPEQSRQIAYVAREALNNVEKHAEAKNVDIHLQWHESEFIMTVRDDGQGFDLTEPDAVIGYGLVIMGERAQAINANFAVASAPGDGTQVTLGVPLQLRT